MYDSTNKYNAHTMEIALMIKDFGLNTLARKGEKKPFMQQLDRVAADQSALSLSLALGNIIHH